METASKPHPPMTEAAKLLERDPRVFWGNVIRILIERGWNPPRPDEKIVDDLLRDMESAGRDARPRMGMTPEEAEHLKGLTPTEQRVTGLLVQGLSNAQIADELGVATKTVKFHLTNLYGKLGVNSRTQAVALVVGGRGPKDLDPPLQGA